MPIRSRVSGEKLIELLLLGVEKILRNFPCTHTVGWPMELRKILEASPAPIPWDGP